MLFRGSFYYSGASDGSAESSISANLQRASIIGTLMLSRNIKNVPGAGRSN
jgi:hypothetical protein